MCRFRQSEKHKVLLIEGWVWIRGAILGDIRTSGTGSWTKELQIALWSLTGVWVPSKAETQDKLKPNWNGYFPTVSQLLACNEIYLMETAKSIQATGMAEKPEKMQKYCSELNIHHAAIFSKLWLKRADLLSWLVSLGCESHRAVALKKLFRSSAFKQGPDVSEQP